MKPFSTKMDLGQTQLPYNQVNKKGVNAVGVLYCLNLCFCLDRKTEMKLRHEEIRQKYGEKFSLFI